MANQIKLTYQGENYILEFTRRSVELMERQGFIAEELLKKPMTNLPALFAGAFIANHRFVKRETIDAIYEKLPNKQDLMTKLVEMYNEPIQSLLDEPEDAEGNATWEASW
jgi:hypothetical protein